MTYQEIYNAVSYRIFGAPANYPQGYEAIMLNIIANIHRKIQRDKNYWFMETATTISVPSAATAITLPADFKEIVRCGFRFTDADTGDKVFPLSQLGRGEQFLIYQGVDDEADYPEFYYIYGGELRVLPKTARAVTLNVDYYGYLPRLAGLADEDVLTQEGYDAIINLSAYEWCVMTKEDNEAMRYLQLASDNLHILGEEDNARRFAERREIPYGDF